MTPRTCPSCSRGQRTIQPATGVLFDCGSLWLNPAQFAEARTEKCMEESARMLTIALEIAKEQMVAYTQSARKWGPCASCKGVGWVAGVVLDVEN